MAHVAWAGMFAAWLLQFVAWRRAVVAKEQLELRVDSLESLLQDWALIKTLARHPLFRDEQIAKWVRDAESR